MPSTSLDAQYILPQWAALCDFVIFATIALVLLKMKMFKIIST